MAGIWKALDVGVSVADFLNNYMGIVEDKVVVRVAGGPRSTKAELHKIAAAVAFGLSPSGVPGLFGVAPPPGSVLVEYDSTKMEVVFQLRWVRSLKTMLVTAAGRAVMGSLPVFNGPSDVVTGANFAFRPPVPGAVAPPPSVWSGKTMLTPTLSVSDPNPDLVGPGAVIPTPNPRPTGDARSRGDLCWMVWQSLATPAESGSQTYPLPVPATRFAGS